MKKARFLLLAGLAVLLAACGWQAGAVSGPAEIPMEILGELDEAARRELLDDPKYVALTFDDGPRPDTTGRLLDGLLERGAAATFFVIGQQVQGNEALLQRMEAEGHQIGNHTYSHIRLQTAEKDTVIEEIHKTEVVLQEAVGAGSYWLRPPYGMIGEQRAALVKTPMVYWSVDPQDWKLLDAGKVAAAVMGCVKPGDIVLLHDFYPSSVDAALTIVDQLQAQGYTFVTVEELFRIQGVNPEAGVLYASPSLIRPLT
jgi:peptidoglycan/xylan/chitin deacetylase (PgdA/CDA1 family)